MFDEVLIAGDRLRRTRRDGDPYVSFKIRLPWYRSLYLSCLDGVQLSLDGRPQALEDIFFRLYGTTYRYSDLRQHDAVLWFVLDQAEILVRQASNVSEGECEIALTLFLRIPYHRMSNFKQVSTCTRSLQIEERVPL